MPKYSCLQVCCQSINLKMAIRAETCSWYLCNKQHITNNQIVVFDSWLNQLLYVADGWHKDLYKQHVRAYVKPLCCSDLTCAWPSVARTQGSNSAWVVGECQVFYVALCVDTGPLMGRFPRFGCPTMWPRIHSFRIKGMEKKSQGIYNA